MKLVIQNTSRVWGGNEKWLSILAEGLLGRGHEVVVSCPRGPVRDGLMKRRIPASGFRPRGEIDFVSGGSFAWWLKRERPDAVLMTSWQPIPWVTWAARRASARTIVRLGIVRSFPREWRRAAAFERIDAMIVNSPEIRETWLRSAPHYLPDRVRVVFNAVQSRLNERESLRSSLRREVGIGRSTVLIGGAGHLAPRKGFEILLRGFADARIPDAHLAILGGGAHLEKLRREARSLRIDDRVTWLGHRGDGGGVIASFDLFVLSSHNEGMANVMLEAMAGGTPVIASDVSGVRSALAASETEGPAGWIVPAADPSALARALVEVSGAIRYRPESLRAHVKEAHHRAVTTFGPERMVSECEQILFGAS